MNLKKELCEIYTEDSDKIVCAEFLDVIKIIKNNKTTYYIIDGENLVVHSVGQHEVTFTKDSIHYQNFKKLIRNKKIEDLGI